MAAVYYNAIDPYAAQWLRNLIAKGHIATRAVVSLSVESLTADLNHVAVIDAARFVVVDEASANCGDDAEPYLLLPILVSTLQFGNDFRLKGQHNWTRSPMGALLVSNRPSNANAEAIVDDVLRIIWKALGTVEPQPFVEIEHISLLAGKGILA
jgi:hypothetical protein